MYNSNVVLPIFLEPAYRLFKLIGYGKYTQTFFAVNEEEYPFIPCVIQKILLPYQKNFELKLQILQHLTKSSQIPKLIDYRYSNDCIYLIFEHVEGINLNTLLAEQGNISENQVWQILTDILTTLKLLHSYKLIHCDIKPENIICRNSSQDFVLVDFATSQVANDYLTSNIIVGSPEYAAPELVLSKPRFSSDLYSLGVTCIYLLTQVRPFDLFDIANNEWAWRHYLQTPISARLGNILDQLINQDVNHRFVSVDEVLMAMGISASTRCEQSWQAPVEHTLTITTHPASEVNAVAIHADGNIIASAHDNKTIYIRDLKTNLVLHTLQGHSKPVTSLAFSPDGKILATGSDDKTIKLWNQDYQEIHTLIGHQHVVKSVAFNPNGQVIASGSWDKTVRLWDVTTGKEVVLTGHKLQVSAVTFSSDGKFLASASFDKTVRLWINNTHQYSLSNILSSHTWAVTAVAFSPDAKILATGSDDNTIKLWYVNTGEEFATLTGHSWSITALVFSSNEVLISASKDKTVKVWQVGNTEEITTLSEHIDSVTSIAIANADTQTIISGSKDKTIKLFKIPEIPHFLKKSGI
ncbi:WD repeat protein with Ser/Thr protein kinase motif [Calothrix sp. NIES-4071]|nr:WD repeat protein with Ser/Thr protein kinase motif [Calothrix sp. NIES-4071]BAZ64075.1 WD repeat protein with Ser/Thr protein kinase motif [Calothrix sp. NIES-4105]